MSAKDSSSAAEELSPLERQTVASTSTAQLLRDLLELTKPNIVLMSLVMTAAAMWLAPGSLPLPKIIWTFIGAALAIASANGLNMYLERDSDALMKRTARRPLPDGRLSPHVALFAGVLWGAAGVVVLWAFVNPVAALLAALMIDTYVLVYTPLKRHTHWAMTIGTIPGAVPPLIGWAAVTGGVQLPGLVVFGVLVLWQIPHFIAIAIYRQADFERAGVHTVPGKKGEAVARRQALLAALLLIPVSLTLIPLGVAGWAYAIPVVLAGLFFFAVGVSRLTRKGGLKGARQFFFASLLYLPLFCLGLMINLVLR